MLGGVAAPLQPLPREAQHPTTGGLADVRSFGAKGDGTADDHPAIQAALEAVRAGGGGVVWFPRGHYRIGTTVAVPAVLSETVVLRGEGMRSTYLYPATTGLPAVRFGASTPDESETAVNRTQYCGMEDLSVTGSLL